MSRISVIGIACAIGLSMAARSSGQAETLGKATLAGGQVTIEFGRPSAEGRDVLSLVKPGVYWRIGDAAGATLTSDVDLSFGDQVVPKGTYLLVGNFKGGETWSIIVAEGSDRGKLVGVQAKALGKLEKTEEHVDELTVELYSRSQGEPRVESMELEADIGKTTLVASLIGKLLPNGDEPALPTEPADPGEGSRDSELDVRDASIVFAWGTSRIVVDFELRPPRAPSAPPQS